MPAPIKPFHFTPEAHEGGHKFKGSHPLSISIPKPTGQNNARTLVDNYYLDLRVHSVPRPRGGGLRHRFSMRITENKPVAGDRVFLWQDIHSDGSAGRVHVTRRDSLGHEGDLREGSRPADSREDAMFRGAARAGIPTFRLADHKGTYYTDYDQPFRDFIQAARKAYPEK